MKDPLGEGNFFDFKSSPMTDSSKASLKQEISPPASGKATRKPRWHLIYYVLALFDILAISGSLYLNHKIVNIYMETVEENEKWNHRKVEYSRLWNIISNVNAPGNNVFDSLNVPREKSIRDNNLELFNRTMSSLRKELETDASSNNIQGLKEELDQIDAHMDKMIDESDQIFSLLTEGQALKAGRRMATMDRKYAVLNSHLVALNLKVGEITHQHLYKQTQNAEMLRRFEYLFGGIIIIMVVGVTLYGNMVARKVHAAEMEKERYLAALKRKQEELEIKNTELTHFSAIASHDLQEPIRKIIAFGNRLKNRLKDPNDQGHDYLNRMEKAALRMSSLIDSLLELSRISADQLTFQKTDLNTIVKEVIDDLEVRIRESGGKIHVSTLPVLNAHPIQMQQLFQNLISNALKFTHKHLPPEVRISHFSDNGYHVIVIEDNGIGFDPRHSDRIFQTFERLHARSDFEGTGIGLSVCEKIVQRHQGNIQVASQVGQGAVFKVRLPANPKSD